jgi:hypothetical protein
VDVVFKGFCDNSPVSSLKFREVVYLMNNVVTRLPRLEDYFASPVISPSFHYIQGSKVQYSNSTKINRNRSEYTKIALTASVPQ